jgi:hypothetical protein
VEKFNNLKKSDLQSGDIIELASGDKCMVIGEIYRKIAKNVLTINYGLMIGYKEDLTHCEQPQFDIMAVYRGELCVKGTVAQPVIWVRPTKKISKKDAENKIAELCGERVVIE